MSSREQQELRDLRQRDREVRQHEQAHVAAGGQYITGGPTYSYTRGPDGRLYATGGEVSIDTSPARTPEETIQKARTVRRAALAPAEPSAQDRRVAAEASQLERQARIELSRERGEESQEGGRSGSESSGPTASGIAAFVSRAEVSLGGPRQLDYYV